MLSLGKVDKEVQPGEVVDCNELKEGGIDEEHADKIPPRSDFCIFNFETKLIE